MNESEKGGREPSCLFKSVFFIVSTVHKKGFKKKIIDELLRRVYVVNNSAGGNQ